MINTQREGVRKMLEGVELIDRSELKEIADRVNARKATSPRVEGEKERRMKEAKRRVDEAKARAILEELTFKADEAAKRGNKSVTVMEINHEDMVRPRITDLRRYDWQALEAEWLIGTARVVYDHLKASNLSPYFTSEHDGVGIKSWWELKIKW